MHKILGEIVIPGEVSRELLNFRKSDVNDIRDCKWIKVKEVKSRNDVDLLLPTLDKGEAEVIVIAKELKADIVIIDELTARKVAIMMNLPIIGAVGLLMKAKKKGLIKKVKPLLDMMIDHGIRYGEAFYRKVLQEIGE
ncbi:MAG: DUF3368 domain-containing protein [Candidatus Anammoxibacter sp.]